MGLVLRCLANGSPDPTLWMLSNESSTFFLCGVGRGLFTNHLRYREMEIHAGERIKEYLAVTGLSVSEFARRLNCHRQNIYDIFKRKTIDVVLLQRISKVLGHDFVSEIYASRQSCKITLKFAITVEIENGQYKVTDVKPIQ